MNNEEILWCERYRPKTVDACILPEQLFGTFHEFVKHGSVPNLLLVGSPGTGKTTVARALCEQLDYDYILINGSNEGRLLDTLRTTITQFASSVSMFAKRKCVIIDEADNTTLDVQKALRGFIEQFSGNCSFIFTGNYKNRLFEPMLSRFSTIEFKIPADEKVSIQTKFFKRACVILDSEKVTYDKAVIAQLVQKFFPDWRRCINELQRYGASGKIDTGILSTLESENTVQLVEWMRTKNFKAIHDWVFTSSTIDLAQLCRDLLVELRKKIKPEFTPGVFVTIADYQHKSVSAIDHQVLVIAMFAALMMEIEFK